ncbi:endolytic transglycosylase MltG [Brevibacillus ruminantium]|uniref:Endolytic murein transglycosylase n=2 Tax=Brevibacillus ruminantium TaxID=2950604 RepID=A0ABY4WMQ5_9BACL|nr:endolytic transglycosylase MltG [Brevibacillus ruminantium]USG68458.1 endolytic transglycosylase MltG [Brevibacillus ruminantium]
MSVKNDDLPDYPQAAKRRRRGGFFRMVLILFCLLLLGTGGVVYYVYQGLQPVAGEAVTKEVEIPAGSSVRQIARILQEHGLIRNSDLFTYYVKYKGTGSRLQAGVYQFETGQSIDQMLQAMADGSTIVDATRFTIPEGWNVEQIADHLAQEGLVDKAKFLQEVNQGSFPEFPFVASIPQKEGRKYRLEGYLFPETYEIKKDTNEHEIIAKMLAQFQKEWKPEWTEQLKAQKLTMDEAVTLASIVEREVVVDKERPIVAGVYYNRMREGWLLQADATVQFVLGKQRDRITFDDLKVESPYNTYLHPGLPPGPIASSGRASLEAVVHPEKHDYFFYVTKKDGTSEHYFSKTLQEHNANDRKSRGK